MLRATWQQNVEHALFAESLAYSALQHGAEFERWLALHSPRRISVNATPAVLVERRRDLLTLTLNRPDKRNAWSAAMRDALCEGLDVALCDSSVEQILLSGAGPAFCAGGDLDEFGAARDAAVAHLSRLSLSAGYLLHRLAERVVVHVHGACVGAGIELPAFAGRIVAAQDQLLSAAGNRHGANSRCGRYRQLAAPHRAAAYGVASFVWRASGRAHRAAVGFGG